MVVERSVLRDKVTIQAIINEPVKSVCYLCYNKEISYDCFVVDPGAEDETELIKIIKRLGLNLTHIILTHEHFDHCMGVNQVRASFPNNQLVCSSECSVAIQQARKNYSLFYKNPGFDCAAADIILEEVGWKIKIAGIDIDFYPALGHSKAGIIFIADNFVFTGDELIKDKKTVTKLKTGSKDKLQESIRLLESWKGKGLIVCPGHGEIFELDDYELTKVYG